MAAKKIDFIRTVQMGKVVLHNFVKKPNPKLFALIRAVRSVITGDDNSIRSLLKV
jgi:hypothetical protein